MVINPAVLRDPVSQIQLWQFPDTEELMSKAGINSGTAPREGASDGAAAAPEVPHKITALSP
jgi:hypothetical protein